MSMQLFSFGHPCEHQLHRACIGGSNCPLNGYPDTWCCSFIKGKINFKRDRPCEGPRCHWDFVHPSQSQFDEVTQVLEQSRPIAAKLDEAKDTDLLSFQINNPHIIDTVQCALHMMRYPPSTCARRVGQLLAYAAVLAGDQDVFVQLLKTMKKPVDGYILGAYAYLTQTKAGGGSAGGGDKGGANQKGNKKQSKKKDGKDDITATLANTMVELMNAALSLGGQLVDREDQHVLQAMLIKALSTYPKGDKRHQEMLEKAIAKFGHRKLDDEEEAAAKREAARREAAAAAAAAPLAPDFTNTTCLSGATSTATNTVTNANRGEASGAPAAAQEPPAAAAAAAATTTAPPMQSTTPTAIAITAATTAPAPTNSSETATTSAKEYANAAAAAVTTPTTASTEADAKALPPPAPAPSLSSAERRTPRETREEATAGATPKTAFSSAPGTPATAAVVIASTNLFNAPPLFSTSANTLPSPQQTLTQISPLATISTNAAAAPASAVAAVRPPSQPVAISTAANTAVFLAVPPGAQPPPLQQQQQQPCPSHIQAPAATGPIIGISKIFPTLRKYASRFDRLSLWTFPPTDSTAPDQYLCGGQLSVKSHLWGPTPLGEAAPQLPMDGVTQRLAKYIAETRRDESEAAARVAEHASLPVVSAGDAGRNTFTRFDSDDSYAFYKYSDDEDSDDDW
ncbi:hypothetical protein ABB37_09336 [Leptomonas pyrrhocoris]|uniref:Uncharacterized protein n=1 Tax=Leptomonas pyrrhocoris TaxID=157538 RepID=A0A0M9FRF9_LEPPY|nr:hypothetical protein ABB37_09336 [Leptomonas pyrrhocoris]KPA74356.1 hypothetical protein ABB37_09336 [Leptomonas pyrrhocoris]|eukprot:XP_015652795.1 hypothetical protein ABB37_09336 [Leptomonas pyrrhocoris]